MVLRLDDLERGLEAGLQAFLKPGLGRVCISPVNQGSLKWYGNELNAVKKSFSLDEATLERILNSQYVQHFYSDRLEQLKERWTK